MHPPGAPQKAPLPGIRYLVAVGSGKGGVGKTTVSVNLAIALAKLGRQVGLLDADVYGPNVPLMMGTRESPTGHAESIRPIEKFGVRVMFPCRSVTATFSCTRTTLTKMRDEDLS